MADQDRWQLVLFPEKSNRREQVVHVAREIGIGKLAATLAKPREIEPQYREAGLGHGARDVGRRFEVLGAGETVGEQRKSARRRERHVENTAERLAVPVLKLDVDFLHTN